MTARTLHTIRLRVEGAPVQLCDPVTRRESGALHSSHGDVEPQFLLVSENGQDRAWLLVQGSKLGGLPLTGPDESWHRAWDAAEVEFLLPSAQGWEPTDDWEDVLNAVPRK